MAGHVAATFKRSADVDSEEAFRKPQLVNWLARRQMFAREEPKAVRATRRPAMPVPCTLNVRTMAIARTSCDKPRGARLSPLRLRPKRVSLRASRGIAGALL